jgi:NAD(P)H dehydrogenase (quinone)
LSPDRAAGFRPKEVRYVDLPEAEYAKALKEHGVPEFMANMLAETDVAVANGTLHTASGDLAALTGCPATTLSAAVGAALHALDAN